MIHKIVNYIMHPKKILLYLITSRFNKFIDDATYLKILYRIKVGRKLDLKNPKTFNEKLQWLKLHDRKEEYTNMVDKIAVRSYIKNTIGEEYLIPLIGVYNKFDDIDFNSLPQKFVIKCNHDSGGVAICKDKKTFDYRKAKEKINKSLKKNYYYSGREWPYKNIKPKILIEKYMKDNKSNELIDYKFMCFDGKVKMIFTCTDRYNGGLKVTFFDLNWKKLPFERHYPSSKKNIEKPKNYDLMLKFSEKLSKGISFLRVDWYEINGKLYFGELTFYPGGGFEEFTPENWDKKIGDLINLPTNESDINDEKSDN